jgi:hypothetical protein
MAGFPVSTLPSVAGVLMYKEAKDHTSLRYAGLGEKDVHHFPGESASARSTTFSSWRLILRCYDRLIPLDVKALFLE